MIDVRDVVKGKKETFQKYITEDLMKAIVVYRDNWDVLLYVEKHKQYPELNGTIIKADVDNLVKTGTYEGNVDELIPMTCPSEGSFLGFTKCYDENEEEYLVTLRIPSDAFRTSSFSGNKKQCRCSKAKVLNIWKMNDSKTDKRNFASSSQKLTSARLKQKAYTLIHANNKNKKTTVYYNEYIYTVGKIIEDKNCIKNRWVEDTGIYFYMTPIEAQSK